MPSFVSIESPKLGSAVQVNNEENNTVVSVEQSAFGSVAQIIENEIVNVYELDNTDIQSYYNEVSRQHTEDAQAAQLAAEAAQSAAETAESNAKASELDAEAAQVAAETAQSLSEAARDASQTAQSLSETAQAGAELAEANAKASELDAEAAQLAAETAQSLSEAARNASQTAQAGAELAQSAAETAETNAEAAQAGAELAESNAKASELDAEAAATASQTAQSLSEAAQAGAELAESGAQTAQSFSESARDAAELSQQNAATAESGAIAARDDSIAAKIASEAARDAAQTARTGAETAESNAQASASGATSAKVAAQAAQANAETAQSAAETAEANAAASASSAASSASSASTDADRAEAAANTAVNTLSAKGDWDASTGVYPTPTANSADFYQISVAGTMTGSQGSMTANIGDQLYWNVDKAVWYKIDNTDHILSVNGQEGAVVLDHTDVGALGATQNAVSASKWQTARTLTVAGDATGAVSIDGSSNVTLNVDVANADKWTAARTLTLSGDVSGSVSWDGSANATLNATVANDSHSHSQLSGSFVSRTASQANHYGESVVLLAPMYDGTNISSSKLDGVLSLYRGGTSSSNSIVSINLSYHSAYNTSRVGYYYNANYGRSTQFVSCYYNGVKYFALRIYNNAQDNVIYWKGTSTVSDSVLLTVIDTIGDGTSEGAGIIQNEEVYNSIEEVRPNTAPLSSGTGGYWSINDSGFIGNASTASKWLDARTLTLSGDATGSVSWDGSANATLAVTVADDSHTHDGRYYTESEADSRFMPKAGGQMDGALTIRHTNVQLNLMDSTYYDNYWQLDHQNGVLAFRYNGGTEDFKLNEDGTAVFSHTVTAPTFSGALSGNASSATKLATSRSLTVGHTTKSFNGTADVSWSANEITGTESAGQETFGSGETVTTDAFISLLAAKGAFSTYYWVCRGSWSYANQVVVDTGNGKLGTAGSVIEVIGTSTTTCTIRVTTPTTSSGGANSRREFIYINNGSSYSPGWRTAYSNHYHPEADKWTTARTITLGGDLTGSVSIDGSSNVTLSASVTNDSHTHSKLSPMNADWNAQTAEFRTGTTSAPAGSGLSNFVNWIQWGHNGGSKYRHTLYSFADGAGMSQLWYGYKNNTSNTTSAATKQRIYMDNYHPLADVATRANGVIVSSSATTAWYDAVWHNNSNGLFSTGSVQIANSTGSLKSNRHYFAGTDYYLREATGAYGTVSTYGRKAGWGGYSIEGRVNFMHNGTDRCGLYNDVSNQWILESTLGAGLKLFYGSSQKLETTSSGVSVSGTLSASRVSVTPIVQSTQYYDVTTGAGVYAVHWTKSGEVSNCSVLVWNGSAQTNGEGIEDFIPIITNTGRIYAFGGAGGWIPSRVYKIG
ncbi:TPA: cell envelope integrity protein TolA [Vibrio parahaemolyticus]|nr:cell envelope integrity protein TolA [Vibrio parahaemolyticus]